MSPHLETFNRWFYEVWTNENRDAIFEMFKPEGIADGLGDMITGPEQFAAFHEALLKLICDVKITFDQHIESGDVISAVCTLTARKRTDPEVTVKMKGTCFAKMGDGVIVHAENFWDFISFFEQLGQLPDNTLMRALSGEVLSAGG